MTTTDGGPPPPPPPRSTTNPESIGVAPGKRRQRVGLTFQGFPAASLAESVLAQQPQGLPMPLPKPNNYLCILQPSLLASTALWTAFQARWQARAEAIAEADDPVPAAVAKAAQELLTWRAALPEPLHFWDEDEEVVPLPVA